MLGRAVLRTPSTPATTLEGGDCNGHSALPARARQDQRAGPPRSPGGGAAAGGLLLPQPPAHATLVGGGYAMGYDDCQVLTNALWKRQAGGTPRHCFLLATALTPGTAADPEDEEVILL